MNNNQFSFFQTTTEPTYKAKDVLVWLQGVEIHNLKNPEKEITISQLIEQVKKDINNGSENTPNKRVN